MDLRGFNCIIKSNTLYTGTYTIVEQYERFITVVEGNNKVDFGYSEIELVLDTPLKLWKIGERLFNSFVIPDTIKGLIRTQSDIKKYINSFIDQIPFIKAGICDKAINQYLNDAYM